MVERSEMFETLREDNEEALKKYPKNLLLSTTYYLDDSYTKKIVVGLEPKADSFFEPVIRLVGSSLKAFSITHNDWIRMEREWGLMDEYFNEAVSEGSVEDPQESARDPIVLSECRMLLTIYHGQRSIIFEAYDGSQKFKKVKDVQKNYKVTQQGCKRRKLSSPTFVMCKNEFAELRKVYDCIDSKYHNILRHVSNVNQCRCLLVQEITWSLLHSTPKPLFDGSYDNIIQHVLLMPKDFKKVFASELELNFVQNYSDIAVREMLTLFLPYILVEVIEIIEEWQ